MKAGKPEHNLHSCVNNARRREIKKACKILVCGGTGCLAGGSDKIL